MKKTIAIGIIALRHDGGLLKRFAGEVGVLPGTTVMVPQDCWCVLVAGDQATAIFDVGPHELQLMQFNRNPSGLLYSVGRAPETFTWYPPGGAFRRDLTVKVSNPLQFVTEAVVKRAFDSTGAVVSAIRERLDALVPPGQILAEPEVALNLVAESLGYVGLTLVDFKEEASLAPEVPPAAPQAQPPPLPSRGATRVGTPPPAPPPRAPAPAPGAPGPAPAPPPGSVQIPLAAPPVAGVVPAAASHGLSSAPGQVAPAGPPVAAPPTPVQGSQGMQAHLSSPVAAPGPAAAPFYEPEPVAAPASMPAASPGAPLEQAVGRTLTLGLTQVWSSSTMELFGKGELTLRVRVLGRPQAVFGVTGPFSYDQTREYLSPDDWLGERHWQALPEEQLCFPGLSPEHFYRVYLLAEERDKGSVDPLGTLEWELGRPQAGELEIG
ncbi:MAG: hypothetical protein RBU30_16125, partial [Polyangia bacterium]|nr:hypothetical protein [Polyangia bacterium]